MRRLGSIALALTLVLSLVVAGCGVGKKETPGGDKPVDRSKLTVGVIPAEAKIPKETMEKFRTYLQDQTGRTVEMTDYPDYNGVVEALNYSKLDVAYLGPLTYVIAHRKSGANVIAAKTAKGVPYYHSYILVHKDSPYKTLDDLIKDKANVTFAFGDPNSTSGSLIPGMELKKRGVYRGKEDSDFKQVIFTGGHDVTALNIENKKVTAGAIDSAYFDKLVEKGTVKAESFRKVWESDKLFQYPFVARKDLDQETIDKLTTALLNLKDKEILDAFAADGFVKATHQDYEAIEKAAEADGRLK